MKYNRKFTSEFNGIKVCKVTIQTKKLPKQDRIYHFVIPDDIPLNWDGTLEDYQDSDCYDPCKRDEEFVEYFNKIVSPNSVRGVSLDFHHMVALRSIGYQTEGVEFPNCDYVLMYNFLRDPEVMPDKPEWSPFYNLSIFEEVLEIFPKLKGYLQKGGFIRGAKDITSGPELRVLIFESLGVNESFLVHMFKHDFPKLQKFEVHIGKDLVNPVDHINAFDPLFSGDCFPELTHLKIAGSYIADEIAYNIAKAPIIHQLKSLDLSGGLLHTRGAEILLNILPKTNIEKLNLSYNVLDETFCNSVKSIKNLSNQFIEINLDSQRDEQIVLAEERRMELNIKSWMKQNGTFIYLK